MGQGFLYMTIEIPINSFRALEGIGTKNIMSFCHMSVVKPSLLFLCRTTLIVLKCGWSTPAGISRYVYCGIVFVVLCAVYFFHVHNCE